VTDVGVEDLLKSPNSSSLRYLDVSYLDGGISAVSVEAIAFSKHCQKLVVLKCKNARLSDQCIFDLAESKNSLDMEELDISLVEDTKREK
jgi:hypothetical protein